MERPSPALAGAVTDRIWPCVELQWEWLGGLPRLHRAAVIGAGARGTGLAVALARAGLEVDLGARHDRAGRAHRPDRPQRRRPARGAAARRRERRRARTGSSSGTTTSSCSPSRRTTLPGAVAAHGGRIPARAGVLVLARGLVPPADTLPSAYVAEAHAAARAVACLAGPGADGALAEGAPVVARRPPTRRSSPSSPTVLRAAGLDVTTTTEVAAVQLAGSAAGAAGRGGRSTVPADPPAAAFPRRLSRLPCVDKEELDREFSELYRAHLRDVYSYSYYRVGNHHDAEDLTEQTFLQAYRHFERAVDESDGRPLRPWLIRIAHNLAANLYRDRARRPQTPIDDTTMLSAVHTTEDLVEGRDELSRILEGIEELPDDRREALIMRFALGMDNREIARAMGRSDGATKVLIHRAIKQLEEIVNVRQAGRH